MYKYYMGKARTNVSASWMIGRIFMGIDEFAHTGNIDEYKEMDKGLLDFDVDRFSKELHDWLSKMDITSCTVNIHRLPNENKPFVIIEVADDEARKVSAWLKYLADIHDMFMHDAISHKSYASRDLFDDDIVTMRARGRSIGTLIRERFKNIAFFDEFDYDYSVRWEHYHYYVLVLRPDDSVSIEDQIAAFRDTLRGSLMDGEKLRCKGKCFTVEPKEWPRWEIVYSLEFDCGDRCVRGYISGRRCVVERLDRPTFLKVKEIVDGHDDCEDIYERLTINEMVDRYPDPIDRFHRSLEISNMLAASSCCVTYARHTRISSGVSFYVVWPGARSSYKYNKFEAASVLTIEEDDALAVLAVMAEVYPYIWERFYTTNYIPIGMWEDIRQRLCEVKKILRTDPLSAELGIYAQKFSFPTRYYDGESPDQGSDEAEIKKRAEAIIELYGIFLKWLDVQMKITDVDGMINVEGP